MAWAVDRVSRAPVYVGNLGEEHVGLRCGCVCPACDADLQAVGVGPNADPGRAPFFRHHLAEQGPGCKYRVAELAALRLLFEKNLIEIPAPRKVSAYRGSSGQVYVGEHVGEAISERVVERRLVSEVQALLTLESGRQVVLVLRGHQDVGELGSVHAVVAIQVSDAEVALLSPEQILARSELQGDWLHVVHPKDDVQYQQLADDDARAKALEAMDIDPAELGLTVGATAKQASESLIHWAVKDALLQLGTLRAPSFHECASATGSDGQLHTVEVSVPPAMLQVSDVVDEILLDGYRPDILCTAVASDGELGRFRLVVEVALTSKVGATKLDRVRRDGLACIELDVRRFNDRRGTVSLTQLRELVRSDVASKVWLHHPRLQALMEQAQARADRARDESDSQRSAAERVAQELRRREEDRAQAKARAAERRAAWLVSLTADQLLAELRLVLDRAWAGEMLITSNGMTWDNGEFEAHAHRLLAPRQLGRQITSYGGVARRLSEISRCVRGERQSVDLGTLLGVVDGFMRWDLEHWLGLFYLAIEHFGLAVNPERENRSEEVLASLRAGKDAYTRPSGFDEVLAGMFPELRPVLEQELGTRAYSKRVEREQQAAAAAAVRAQEAAAEAAAIAESQRKADEAAERERQRLPDAVNQVTYQLVWKPNLKVPKSEEDAVDFLRFSRLKNANDWTKNLVAEGWRARRAGQDFKLWFTGNNFEDAEAVRTAREALESAFLIELRRR